MTLSDPLAEDLPMSRFRALALCFSDVLLFNSLDANSLAGVCVCARHGWN